MALRKTSSWEFGNLSIGALGEGCGGGGVLEGAPCGKPRAAGPPLWGGLGRRTGGFSRRGRRCGGTAQGPARRKLWAGACHRKMVHLGRAAHTELMQPAPAQIGVDAFVDRADLAGRILQVAWPAGLAPGLRRGRLCSRHFCRLSPRRNEAAPAATGQARGLQAHARTHSPSSDSRSRCTSPSLTSTATDRLGRRFSKSSLSPRKSDGVR